MRLVPALALLMLSLVRAEVAIQVDGAWYEPGDNGGAFQYVIRTNLPNRAILDLSLDSEFDSVEGTLERSAARTKAEVANGECKGKVTGFAAALPPGRYTFTVNLSSRQREEVEEAMKGQGKPMGWREVFVGGPTALVEAFRAEGERLARSIAAMDSLVARLDEWVQAFDKGKLKERAPEYVAWREGARKEIDSLVEQAALYHDKFPTHFPACYAAVSDALLNLGDHESALYTMAQGKQLGDDQGGAKGMNLDVVRRLLAELRFKYVWEESFGVVDLPAELARMTAPDAGLPRREDWDAWRKDLDRACEGLAGLVKAIAPDAEKGAVRAGGVEAAPPEETTADAKRQLNTNRLRVVKEVAPMVEPARKALAALVKMVDDAVGKDAAPLPATIKKTRDDLVAAQEKVRAELRTYYK